MPDPQKTTAVRDLLASAAMGLLATVGLIALLTLPAYAEGDPAPALIVVDGGYPGLQVVRRQAEQVGGRVRHIFPPNALIVWLTPIQADQVRRFAQVVSLTFDPVEEVAALGLDAQPAVAVWNSVFHGAPLEFDTKMPFFDDVLIPPEPPVDDGLPAPEGLLAQSPAPGYYDTSEYLIGDVVVAVVLPESNGVEEPSTEDWTASEVATAQSTTVAGMDHWGQAEANAGLTFIYVWTDVPPTGAVSYTVECDFEAKDHSNFDSNVINNFMARLGYANSTSWWTNVRDYLNDLRDLYAADWAYLVQIRDGSGRASAYLGGPATTIYDSDLRGGYVVAHESGHIFNAMDEYCPDACQSPIGRYGYQRVVNANSSGPEGDDGPGYFDGHGEGVSSVMRNTTYAVNPYTRGQVGWRDADGDGILDVRDTFPDTTLLTPTLGATLFISGQAMVVPLPGWGSGLSLNVVAGVDARVNGLTWLPATPTDGDFDEPQESFQLDLPLLPNGVYTIQARGRNDVGNVERSYARTTITVTGSPVANAIPFAAFEAIPSRFGATATLTVDASASADLEGHALQARWDWQNDGVWDTPWSATLTGTHQYTQPGDVVVALGLQDSLGATTTVTRLVHVTDTNAPPVPCFVVVGGDRRFGTTTPSFTFDARSSRDTETPFADLEFRWDFDGNGSWDTGWATAPHHLVSTTFTLDDQDKGDGLPRSDHWVPTLQVRDGDGATAEATRVIWANPYDHPPAVTGLFSTTVGHTAIPIPVDFSLTSDPDYAETWDALLEYRFDWEGDGNWDADFASASVWSNYKLSEPGVYPVTMQVQDRYGATDEISQTITILTAPAMVLSGDALRANVLAGESAQRTLAIANRGGYSLTFSLEELVLGVPVTYTVTDNVTGSLAYAWKSAWPGALFPEPADWTPTTGTRDADDEGYVGPIELGFPFPFYGQVYDQVYLAANGYLAFAPPPADFGSGDIPSATLPNGLASAFWADLNLGIVATEWPTDGIGGISYNPQTEDGLFVAEYWSAGVHGDPGWRGNDFEIVLYPNGTLLLQYSWLNHSPTAPTGVESPDGSQGLTYTYPLTNNLAVAFVPDQGDIPWLTLSVMAGTVAGGDAIPVVATFDATGLDAGVYTGRLLVYTDDPAVPFVNLPVTLTVWKGQIFLPVIIKNSSP